LPLTRRYGVIYWQMNLMLEKIKNWLQHHFSSEEVKKPKTLSTSGYIGARRPGAPKKAVEKRPTAPESVEIEPAVEGRIESQGPGKNVLIRNRYVREDTGTHETLKILDDSMVDSGEETGLDPYNTGKFDRSKKWDQRFRK
jgi:hypothetical protein